MPRRVYGVVVVVLLGILLVGCTRPPQSQPVSSPEPESIPHAVVRLMGSGALASTVDTRTLPDRPPFVFVEVHVDTTPTATAVLGVLSAMQQEYAGQGRHMSLRLILPEHPRSEPLAVMLRWNPTSSAVPALGADAAMPPESMWLALGHGSDVIRSSANENNIPLGSDVTTSAVVAAAGGKGELVATLRRRTGLP